MLVASRLANHADLNLLRAFLADLQEYSATKEGLCSWTDNINEVTEVRRHALESAVPLVDVLSISTITSTALLELDNHLGQVLVDIDKTHVFIERVPT